MNTITKLLTRMVLGAGIIGSTISMAYADGAYLEITFHNAPANRAKAAEVYTKYKQPFLTTVAGAKSKELLVRNDDVQVLHGFASVKDAENYLTNKLFTDDVVVALKPLLIDAPEVRIYEAH